jgi:hypothetical protein
VPPHLEGFGSCGLPEKVCFSKYFLVLASKSAGLNKRSNVVSCLRPQALFSSHTLPFHPFQFHSSQTRYTDSINIARLKKQKNQQIFPYMVRVLRSSDAATKFWADQSEVLGGKHAGGGVLPFTPLVLAACAPPPYTPHPAKGNDTHSFGRHSM